jgi:hypothetical protein
MSQHLCIPDRYGSLFPDVSQLQFNKPNQGKVASIQIESHGIGIQNRGLSIDQQQWEACLKCDRFDDCYKLSIAKLMMQQTLATLA